MATSQTPQVSQLAVQYEDVKAWITAQEKVERETSKPAPLTEAQRKALEALYHSIKSPSPEPELDDNDWVSVLKSMNSDIFDSTRSGTNSHDRLP